MTLCVKQVESVWLLQDWGRKITCSHSTSSIRYDFIKAFSLSLLCLWGKLFKCSSFCRLSWPYLQRRSLTKKERKWFECIGTWSSFPFVNKCAFSSILLQQYLTQKIIQAENTYTYKIKKIDRLSLLISPHRPRVRQILYCLLL